jgi:hypothetical protein
MNPRDLPVRDVRASLIERIEIQGHGMTMTRTRETADDLARLGRDPATRSYVVMLMRPGARYFMTYLEYTFYPPGRPHLNALLGCRNVEWEDLPWSVATIPAGDGPKAEEAAQKAELLIKDGMPATITHDGIAHFPLQGKNCFNLESRPGAAVYRGRSGERAALALETEECDAIMAEYKRAHYPADRS